MAEIDMSWTTERQVVESDYEPRDASEFEDFDI